MGRVLVGLQWEQCLVYIDDIVVFGKNIWTGSGTFETGNGKVEGRWIEIKRVEL